MGTPFATATAALCLCAAAMAVAETPVDEKDGCVDQDHRWAKHGKTCADMESLCKDVGYSRLLRSWCPRTCGVCGGVKPSGDLARTEKRVGSVIERLASAAAPDDSAAASSNSSATVDESAANPDASTIRANESVVLPNSASTDTFDEIRALPITSHDHSAAVSKSGAGVWDENATTLNTSATALERAASSNTSDERIIGNGTSEATTQLQTRMSGDTGSGYFRLLLGASSEASGKLVAVVNGPTDVAVAAKNRSSNSSPASLGFAEDGHVERKVESQYGYSAGNTIADVIETDDSIPVGEEAGRAASSTNGINVWQNSSLNPSAAESISEGNGANASNDGAIGGGVNGSGNHSHINETNSSNITDHCVAPKSISFANSTWLKRSKARTVGTGAAAKAVTKLDANVNRSKNDDLARSSLGATLSTTGAEQSAGNESGGHGNSSSTNSSGVGAIVKTSSRSPTATSEEDSGECPEGFEQVIGHVHGADQWTGSRKVLADSILDCSRKCIRTAGCGSFEFSNSSKRCFRHSQTRPTSEYVRADFIFCRRAPCPSLKTQESCEGPDVPGGYYTSEVTLRPGSYCIWSGGVCQAPMACTWTDCFLPDGGLPGMDLPPSKTLWISAAGLKASMAPGASTMPTMALR